MEVILTCLVIFIALFLVLFLVFNFVPLMQIMLAKATGKVIIPYKSDPIDDMYQNGEIDYLEMVRLKRQRAEEAAEAKKDE